MSETKRGKLVWSSSPKGRHRRVQFPTKKGGLSQPAPFDQSEIDAKLLDEEGDEIEIDLELKDGKPCCIRPVGQPWKQPQSRVAHRTPGRPTLPGEFHNPYGFVPAPPRRHANGPLGDSLPPSRLRYHDSLFSGRIRVRMTTDTPLLIPDASRVTSDASGHKSFPARTGADGRPHLAPTSIKGALRSAYEAVTNSRMAVFQSHGARLGLRTAASKSLGLVPCRIRGEGEDASIQLLTGKSTMGADGRPGGGVMYAAWLELYRRARGCPDREWADLDRHRKHVWAYITLWKHVGRTQFQFWNVAALVSFEKGKPATHPKDERPTSHKLCQEEREGHWVEGWVCITGRNADNKHDERVFFGSGPHVPLSPELRTAWKELIRNYRLANESELKKGRSKPGALNDNRTEWSRHIARWETEETLSDGALCHAAVATVNGQITVTRLFPVMISRNLHECSPDDLLPENSNLRPAGRREELSPADRVFGWVNQNGSGAFRGGLRIGPVHCQDEDAMVAFDSRGVPLAILGAPRPEQTRFYVASDSGGQALPAGLERRKTGYGKPRGLRGRKFYPHHAGLPEGFWDKPETDRTQNHVDGRFQEYYRAGSIRDEQNRSMLGWVRPKSTFEFDLDVLNLTAVELGALLWLFRLPEGAFLRLGAGKPLGFGSVRLDLTGLDLKDGVAARAAYEAFDEQPSRKTGKQLQDPAEASSLIDCFQDAMAGTGGEGATFDSLPQICAFLTACKGFEDGLPIHYPRARDAGAQPGVPLPPHQEGKSFEWFVENEREERGTIINGLTLPDLHEDRGLPLLKKPPPRERPASPGGQRRPDNQRNSGRRHYRGGRS